jgi:hypothetical protein
MKKLPIGIQTFRKIREDDAVYADKTELIYKLLNDNDVYFLSRPRRFGKSLLLDTIAEVLAGSRELFDGLWIAGSDYDWQPHPVIRVDFGSISTTSPAVLTRSIMAALDDVALSYGVDAEADDITNKFKRLIDALAKKHNTRVAVLIDEYDKAMLDCITNIELASANREVLHNLYMVLKAADANLRFVFLTGVSKFTKTSVFSSLNNLKDITLKREYANICGFTEDDFDNLFADRLALLMQDDINPATLRDRIFKLYDGYSWDGKNRLFNPFSLLNYFDEGVPKSYWYASGTPTFLMDLLKSRPAVFDDLEDAAITESQLDKADMTNPPLIPLLFQTGYLTVGEAVQTEYAPIYRLRMPNDEVREAFSQNVVETLTGNTDGFNPFMWQTVKDALRTGEVEAIGPVFETIYSSIPGALHHTVEGYYHVILLAMLQFMGFRLLGEVNIAGGRIDAVLEQADKVYVCEIKHEKLPEDSPADKIEVALTQGVTQAFGQIEERGYAKPYEHSGKRIIKMAVAITAFKHVRVEKRG